MRKRWRKLFAALAFATLGPLGCVVGDAGPEENTSELEEAYSYVTPCTKECDGRMWYCLTWLACDTCTNPWYDVDRCIREHQSCLLACPPPPDCSCQNGSYCCRNSNGTYDCTPQGTCSGGGGGGDGGGGGGGGGGGCDDDWDCSVIEECGSSGSCVPLGCG